MGLKAPSLITFMLSVIVTVIALVSAFAGAEIPVLKGNEFYAVLLAQLVLALGCVTEAL